MSRADKLCVVCLKHPRAENPTTGKGGVLCSTCVRLWTDYPLELEANAAAIRWVAMRVRSFERRGALRGAR